MTKEKMWEIAFRQSAYDCNCKLEDFSRETNIITRSVKHPRARKYLPLPFACDMVSYGNNIVAQTSEELEDAVREYITRYDVSHAFEAPHIHALDELLLPYGYKTCFMAEYFLPELDALSPLPVPAEYEVRLLHPADFVSLYRPEWSNALCASRRQLDILGVGAYWRGELVALAGCSADAEDMYQIGIDVLPAHRRKGLASALTSRLALEILALDKVPFYCAAWCNVKSVRNALKCGFRPAWVELSAREITYVNFLNTENRMR